LLGRSPYSECVKNLFERLLIEEGCDSELVYDEEHEVFRFADGRRRGTGGQAAYQGDAR
jgi:hypothetical protein